MEDAVPYASAAGEGDEIDSPSGEPKESPPAVLSGGVFNALASALDSWLAFGLITCRSYWTLKRSDTIRAGR